MKAFIYERYGPPDVLELKEVETPTPGANELLIRICATTVTSGDWRARSLDMPAGFAPLGRLIFGVTRPRKPILGTTLAGVVETVGDDVDTFAIGDRVVGFSGASMGCYAEFKCMAVDEPVVLKPDKLTFEEAVALPFGGTTALDFYRKAALRPGEHVLVNGASGDVGTMAVQLARQMGAEVTGVCSTANIDLVQSLGAHRVIDYKKEDFTESGQSYDVIVDTVGTAPYSRSKHSLKDGGRLLLVLGGLGDLLRIPWVSMTTSHRVIGGAAAEHPEDLKRLMELAENGAIRPVIDRQYSFEQIPDAHRYVDTGRKKGSVVITVTDDC